MKKYSNIPFRERKRNDDRVYRHEARLEVIAEKRAIRDKFSQAEQECKTDDKEREWVENEVYQRLKTLAERSENGKT